MITEDQYKSVILTVDGSETTLEEFIKVNRHDPDVHHISDDELNDVLNLEVGDSIIIGVVETKRVK